MRGLSIGTLMRHGGRFTTKIYHDLGRRKGLGEVCSPIDSHVDRTFLIEVFFISASGTFLKRGIMNHFNQNSARILASRKECYAQKNRSPQ